MSKKEECEHLRKETVRSIVQKYKSEGKSIEEAKDKLVQSGLNRKLVERFIHEIFEGQA